MDLGEYSSLAAGQRFELNLDDPGDDSLSSPAPAPMSLAFVKDVTERDLDALPPPPPTQLTSSNTGFPEHKKRAKTSRFKQKHGTSKAAGPPSNTRPGAHTSQASGVSGSRLEQDRRQADQDSQRVLDGMSEEEIAEERRELLSGSVPGITPSLIERLLKRANINEDTSDPLEPPRKEKERDTNTRHENSRQEQEQSSLTATKPEITVTLTEPTANSPTPPLPSPSQPSHTSNPPPKPAYDHTEPSSPPPDLLPVSSKDPLPPPNLPPPPSSHFPTAAPPDLDPSSPSFLADLQTHYFPTLSPDPSALSWMAPVPTGVDSTYNPTSTSLLPSELRFDFKGNLLPPALSQQMPSHLGLHHHAHAPDAAGYTIAELSIWCRSKMAAQKCAGMQTLGRICYRLGQGYYGPEGSELYEGLWKCIEEGKGLDVMLQEAAREENSGNRTVWAVATEGVWNWRRGGGRKRLAE